jgi:hypothetical protein
MYRLRYESITTNESFYSFSSSENYLFSSHLQNHSINLDGTTLIDFIYIPSPSCITAERLSNVLIVIDFV